MITARLLVFVARAAARNARARLSRAARLRAPACDDHLDHVTRRATPRFFCRIAAAHYHAPALNAATRVEDE